MLETRLDMQRAKLESMTRARMKREDDAAISVGADTAGLSPIDMVDMLPAGDAVEPITA
jgi:hypothetical protein